MFNLNVHLLTDPFAEHPVVNSRNICSGGGGDDVSKPPQVPDYSQYISAMSGIGNQGQTWARDLFSWAQQQGLDLNTLAKKYSQQAGDAATGQQQTGDQMLEQWRNQYDPLYKMQRDDATRMYADLPQTEEKYAGAYGADAGQAIDQQLAAEQRQQQSMGISPGIGSTALDTAARIGRAAATTAAAEQGRMAARTEARNVTGQAIQTGQFIPGVAGQQQGMATANRAQAASIPMTAASTSAGLYQPSQGYYSASYPYMASWGNTMGTSYNQALAGYSAYQNAEAQNGGGFMDTVAPALLGAAGTVAGAYFGGPAGAAAGGQAGKAIGGGIAKAKTGGKIPPNGGRRIPRFAKGGAIDLQPPGSDGGSWSMPQDQGNYIPPSASPSGGGQTDDVHAMVSAGEFVIPERTVDWYGEKFFQNLITKADSEAQQETVAEPEEAQMDGQQMAAMDTMPPMFRSEGARV